MNDIQLSPLLAMLLGWFIAEGFLRITVASRRLGRSSFAEHSRVLLAHGVMAWLALWLTVGWAMQSIALGALLGTAFMLGRMAAGPGSGGTWLGVTEKTLELATIAVAWLTVSDQWWVPAELGERLSNEQTLLIVLAYVVVIWPVSRLVGWVCKPWIDVAVDASALPKAGAWIGMLERVLVLTFILMNEIAAIGFLLAAKSILRFGGTQEKDHRKLTEYVLIGTLASFTVTILLGILVRGLLHLA
ncbi:MAG: DUF3307 domain-containing protein [Xanthomonadales bacterium]|nr:DUF3307 domain-containing protein [Xanthomonadales bacterium]